MFLYYIHINYHFSLAKQAEIVVTCTHSMKQKLTISAFRQFFVRVIFSQTMAYQMRFMGNPVILRQVKS